MFNREMRLYDYYTYNTGDAYGQPVLNQEPAGQVKMAIFTTSQSIQDNINYKNATYLGLSSSLLDDNCVIQYGDTKLKVLYVGGKGRFKQIYLAEL